MAQMGQWPSTGPDRATCPRSLLSNGCRCNPISDQDVVNAHSRDGPLCLIFGPGLLPALALEHADCAPALGI
jgi:hypothetical protein